MPFIPSLREGSTLLDVFRMFPETSKPLILFHEALLRAPSPFSEAERELIAAYVSSLNRCRYCRGVHTATAELLGVTAGTVERLVENFESAPVSDRMRPVLRYAEKLTRDPRAVSRDDAQAILQAGWDEAAVYYAVAVTALFNFMNRLVEGLGIEFDPAYVSLAAKRLAERGYLPLIGMLPG
jgi:uncharacterized peroxidase-related enzyme